MAVAAARRLTDRVQSCRKTDDRFEIDVDARLDELRAEADNAIAAIWFEMLLNLA